MTSFSRATVISIPKNLRLYCTSSSNYRAIALSSIFGKVLDKTLLNRKISAFQTSNLQFGFKENSSTDICSSAAIEAVEYNVSNNSSIHLLLIDASKAFDRLSHKMLFKLLLERVISLIVVRLLFNMYTHSNMYTNSICIFSQSKQPSKNDSHLREVRRRVQYIV